MNKHRVGLEFAIHSNVCVQVIGPNNDIRQEVNIHNKATQQLVRGIMRFIKGELTASNKRPNENEIVYKQDAKKYVPCYINIGTGGIRLKQTSAGVEPDYGPDRHTAPVEDWWQADTNYVHFTDIKLEKEQTAVARYPIGVLQLDTDIISVSYQGGDIEQIVLATDVAPGTFKTIYGGIHDIYITELGLFPTSMSGETDLLARVILKNTNNILYVRPQDTIIINWIISIISLNDYSEVDEDSPMTVIDSDHESTIDQTIPAGTVIDDNIPYDGTIEPNG